MHCLYSVYYCDVMSVRVVIVRTAKLSNRYACMDTSAKSQIKSQFQLRLKKIAASGGMNPCTTFSILALPATQLLQGSSSRIKGQLTIIVQD